MLTHRNTVSSVTIAGRLSRHTQQPPSHPAHPRPSSSNATRTQPNTGSAEKRHTHATALARAGWTAPEIAARLGQSHPASADVYIHLASDDLTERLRRTQHLVWRPAQDGGGDGTP